MLDDNMRSLVEENTALVPWVIKRYFQITPTEDLVSCGYVGLCKAAERFDQSKNTNFTTYAVWKIRTAIDNEVRRIKDKKERNCLSTDLMFEPGLVASETIEDKRALLPFEIAELNASLDNLSLRVLELSAAGYTQAEIGRVVGVRQGTVSKLAQKIKRQYFGVTCGKDDKNA